MANTSPNVTQTLTDKHQTVPASPIKTCSLAFIFLNFKDKPYCTALNTVFVFLVFTTSQDS